MTNIPHARAKADEASFPTLQLGRLHLSRRRTHARGGSNSVVVGPPPPVEVAEAGREGGAALTTAAEPDSDGASALMVFLSLSRLPRTCNGCSVGGLKPFFWAGTPLFLLSC